MSIVNIQDLHDAKLEAMQLAWAVHYLIVNAFPIEEVAVRQTQILGSLDKYRGQGLPKTSVQDTKDLMLIVAVDGLFEQLETGCGKIARVRKCARSLASWPEAFRGSKPAPRSPWARTRLPC